MKKNDVQINATYLVKVAGNLVPVKITSEHPSGGWEGTSAKTGKTIRIKSAQRLRKRLDDAATDATKTQDATKDAKAEPDILDLIIDRELWTIDNAKKMSLLDTAVHILSLGTGDPMRCKDIVDLAVARDLWTPGKGKTPASTLYASILQEIKTKGDACRFVKTERGKFALKDSRYIQEQAAKKSRQA